MSVYILWVYSACARMHRAVSCRLDVKSLHKQTSRVTAESIILFEGIAAGISNMIKLTYSNQDVQIEKFCGSQPVVAVCYSVSL